MRLSINQWNNLEIWVKWHRFRGTQSYIPELAQKQIKAQDEKKAQLKAEKKRLKAKGRKATPPEVTPQEEERMDRAAQELAMKMAVMRTDLEVTSYSLFANLKTKRSTNLIEEVWKKSGFIFREQFPYVLF